MPIETVDDFTINYTMFTRAEAGEDMQFGMDFTLTNTRNMPLCQVIFPATAVGTNIPGQWNIDNHRPGNDPLSLVFTGAENGVINDTPREISHPNKGKKSTKFAVYRVDIQKAEVQKQGVKFGYSIDTDSATPVTEFSEFARSIITNEQKNIIRAKCPYIKFV